MLDIGELPACQVHCNEGIQIKVGLYTNGDDALVGAYKAAVNFSGQPPHTEMTILGH
jgi:hypothetical protein